MKPADFNTQVVTHAAVAVLVRADGQVLMGQRPEGKAWAGWWEFPGGKVEEGELPGEALVRELQEELGITVAHAYPWLTRQFDYPEKTVKLHFYMVRAWHGEPYGKEGQLLLWQHPRAVTVSPVLPANAPILKALQLPLVYANTDMLSVGETIFFERFNLALNNGLRLIQVHEPALAKSALIAFAERVVQCATPYAAIVLLRGDIELAQTIGADGVHLEAEQMMSLTTRPEVPWCIATCHHAEHMAYATMLGLDGVVFATAKQAVPDWANFSSMIIGNTMPVYADVGIDANSLDAAWQSGAHGVATTIAALK